jgi:hypothetical protein
MLPSVERARLSCSQPLEDVTMGNGSRHGKEAERVEQPPKGANIIGEDGKMMRFEPETPEGEQPEAKKPEKVSANEK